MSRDPFEPITDAELVRFKDQINSVLLSRFIARIDADAKRIAELTRKGEDLCQFAGTMMLAARRVLGIDRAPYRPETGMDSFSPDAKILYDLITHPSAAGYADAITAKDERIAALEHEVSVYLKRIDEAQARMSNLESDRDEAIAVAQKRAERIAELEAIVPPRGRATCETCKRTWTSAHMPIGVEWEIGRHHITDTETCKGSYSIVTTADAGTTPSVPSPRR